MFARFQWGQHNLERKLHSVSWQLMCLSKLQGGIGFKHLELYNLALLAKQGWQLLYDTQSLMYKVFKTKYFPHVGFLQSSLGRKPSYVWSSCFAAKNVLLSRRIWKIGKGNRVNIIRDRCFHCLGNLISYFLISLYVLIVQLILC